jgi:hypothetical protein
MTNITLFDQPQQLPAYLQTSAVAKQLAEQIDGGLAGKSVNRISLRNGKFRFIKGGVEVGVSRNPNLDVVIIAANPHVGRLYYIKAFDPEDAGTRPDCYSIDGKVPEPDSPAKQSDTCALCPQNVVGSAKNGQGRACAFKKRLVVVADNDIAGEAFAIDAGGMSMFGDDDPAQRLFSLKTYIETLKANHLIVPAVVTRLTFDDEASVPKLFFTPIRILTAAEFGTVETRITDPQVRDMLADLDNKTEADKPVGQITAPINTAPVVPQPAAPAPAPQPATPAPAAQAAPPAQSLRRGRRPANQTAPAAAPAPNAAPAAGGFGLQPTPPVAAAPAAPAAAPAAGGFSLDLDAFDA